MEKLSKRFRKKTTVLEKSQKEEAEYQAQLEKLRLQEESVSPDDKRSSSRRPLPAVPPPSYSDSGAARSIPARRGRTPPANLSTSPPALATRTNPGSAHTGEIIYSPGGSSPTSGSVVYSTSPTDTQSGRVVYASQDEAFGFDAPSQQQVEGMYQTISSKDKHAFRAQRGANPPDRADAQNAPLYQTISSKNRRSMMDMYQPADEGSSESPVYREENQRPSHEGAVIYATAEEAEEETQYPEPTRVSEPHSITQTSLTPYGTLGRAHARDAKDEHEQQNVRAWMGVTMDRGQAQAVLEDNGSVNGSYLLRKSSGGSYGLSICASGRVFHMKVMMEPSPDFQMRWFIHGDRDGGRDFGSLWELILHYKKKTSRLNWHLTHCVHSSMIP